MINRQISYTAMPIGHLFWDWPLLRRRKDPEDHNYRVHSKAKAIQLNVLFALFSPVGHHAGQGSGVTLRERFGAGVVDLPGRRGGVHFRKRRLLWPRGCRSSGGGFGRCFCFRGLLRSLSGGRSSIGFRGGHGAALRGQRRCTRRHLAGEGGGVLGGK